VAGCAAGPLARVATQQPTRVGILLPATAQSSAAGIEAFRQGLREYGYIEGQQVILEVRYSDGRDERLPELAAELVHLHVDVILTGGGASGATVRAAQQATSTIPIVLGAAGEPVATGLVESLARPGGNITGMALMSAQTMGKRLELLNETLPGVSRLAVISVETNPLHVPQDRDIQDAARPLGIQVHILSVRGADDLEGALVAATSVRAEAIYGPTDSVITNARARLAELSMRLRLPSLFDYRENVDAGGLFSYGPDLVDTYRRAASYVDKVLKAAKPADLPVQQPTKLDLVVNLRTAQALGLTIPQSVLAQATEIIQ
jgi:putative ABC transport system substrate-binding protein